MSYNHSTHCPVEFVAALSQDDVHDLESFAGSQETGICRRVTLAVCNHDADRLREIRDDSPDAFADLKAMVGDYRTHAAALLDLATIAEGRLAQIDAEGSAKMMQ